MYGAENRTTFFKLNVLSARIAGVLESRGGYLIKLCCRLTTKFFAWRNGILVNLNEGVISIKFLGQLETNLKRSYSEPLLTVNMSSR